MVMATEDSAESSKVLSNAQVHSSHLVADFDSVEPEQFAFLISNQVDHTSTL